MRLCARCVCACPRLTCLALCCSLLRYFAYRYAPLASDMVNLASLDLTLQLGYPFRPMEQLLGVLPPASGKFLPSAYRALMDPRTSPVADFYPLDFSIDMNGSVRGATRD